MPLHYRLEPFTAAPNVIPDKIVRTVSHDAPTAYKAQTGLSRKSQEEHETPLDACEEKDQKYGPAFSPANNSSSTTAAQTHKRPNWTRKAAASVEKCKPGRVGSNQVSSSETIRSKSMNGRMVAALPPTVNEANETLEEDISLDHCVSDKHDELRGLGRFPCETGHSLGEDNSSSSSKAGSIQLAGTDADHSEDLKIVEGVPKDPEALKKLLEALRKSGALREHGYTKESSVEVEDTKSEDVAIPGSRTMFSCPTCNKRFRRRCELR